MADSGFGTADQHDNLISMVRERRKRRSKKKEEEDKKKKE